MSLLRLDVEVELSVRDGDNPVREELRDVEFYVHNARRSASWPLPLLQSVTSTSPAATRVGSTINETEETSNEINKEVFLEDITETERTIGPSLFFYGPLGGQISKEFRALLRRGLVCILTRLALQQLSETEMKDMRLQSMENNSSKNDNSNNSGDNCGHSLDVGESFIYIKQRALNEKVLCVHWSPKLLQGFFSRADFNLQRFTARLSSTAATLIPIVKNFRTLSPSSSMHVTNNLHLVKPCQLVFTLRQMRVVRQSVHDERIADQLASILYQSYLKPTEQLREAGGEALQETFFNPRAAFEYYQNALALAQKGVLYPYSHALRPPPSLEDRLADMADDDIYDEYPLLLVENGPRWGRDIAPANRYFNVLLNLCKGQSGESEILQSIYSDPLLAIWRSLFFDAHALLHVWHALHRMVIVATANAAHTLLLMPCAPDTSSSTPSVPSSPPLVASERMYTVGELRQRQNRAARWCQRVLGLVRRLLISWDAVTVEEIREHPTIAQEWVKMHSLKFKLLLRRVKLLRAVGSVDESHAVYLETEEQLSLFSAQGKMTAFCHDKVISLFQDVRQQLALEQSFFSDEKNNKAGLVWRL